MDRKEWLLSLLATVLLIALAGSGWRFWNGKAYDFDFAEIDSADEARAFQNLAEKLQAADDWRPWPTSRGGDFNVWQERYDSLSQRYPESVIVTPSGLRFVTGDELKVPTLEDRKIYSRIAALMRSYPPPSDPKQTTQTPDATSIKAAWSRRRWKEWCRLATTEGVVNRLGRLELPTFPESPFSEEAEADAENWVAGFQMAVRKQLVPLIEWHELMAKTRRCKIGEHESCSLFLVPRDSQSPFARAKGFSAEGDLSLAVCLAKEGGSAPLREFRPLTHYATGIDLNHVRLSPNRERTGGIACDFSEAKVFVRSEQFKEFLRHLGLPREFQVMHIALENQLPRAPGLAGLRWFAKCTIGTCRTRSRTRSIWRRTSFVLK